MGTHRGQNLYGVGDVYSQEEQKLKSCTAGSSNEDPISYCLLHIYPSPEKWCTWSWCRNCVLLTHTETVSLGSRAPWQRGRRAGQGQSWSLCTPQPHWKLAGKPPLSRETSRSGSFSSPILSNSQHSPCSRVSLWACEAGRKPRWLFRRKKPHSSNFLKLLSFWKGHTGWASWHNKGAFSKKHLKLFLKSAS